MFKNVILVGLMIPALSYAEGYISNSPVQNEGFSISIGAGYWNMKGNKPDLYNQTNNTDRSSYGLLSLSYMYDFHRINWNDVHYGLGVQFYSLNKSGESSPLVLPKMTITKYFTDNLNIQGSFGTLLYLYDFGVNIGYNFTKNINVKLGVNYTPSTTMFNHSHDINAYSTQIAMQYTF